MLTNVFLAVHTLRQCACPLAPTQRAAILACIFYNVDKSCQEFPFVVLIEERCLFYSRQVCFIPVVLLLFFFYLVLFLIFARHRDANSACSIQTASR